MPYQEAQGAAGSKTPSRVSAQDTGVATSHGLPSDDWFLGEKSQANKEKQVTLLGTRKVPLKDILCVIPRVCFQAVVRSANPALPSYQQRDNEAEAEGLISQKSLLPSTLGTCTSLRGTGWSQRPRLLWYKPSLLENHVWEGADAFYHMTVEWLDIITQRHFLSELPGFEYDVYQPTLSYKPPWHILPCNCLLNLWGREIDTKPCRVGTIWVAHSESDRDETLKLLLLSVVAGVCCFFFFKDCGPAVTEQNRGPEF